MRVAVLAVLTVCLVAGMPKGAAESHKYADQVLAPRFVAAWNSWIREHPSDRPDHPWEHCETLDAGDVERWRAVRESFAELDRALQRAGYQ